MSLRQESDWSGDSPSTKSTSSDRKSVKAGEKRCRSNPKASLFLQCCLLGTLLAGVVLAVVLSLWLTSSTTTRTSLSTGRRCSISLDWSHRSKRVYVQFGSRRQRAQPQVKRQVSLIFPPDSHWTSYLHRCKSLLRLATTVTTTCRSRSPWVFSWKVRNSFSNHSSATVSTDLREFLDNTV